MLATAMHPNQRFTELQVLYPLQQYHSRVNTDRVVSVLSPFGIALITAGLTLVFRQVDDAPDYVSTPMLYRNF
jgi:hypothetical protein